MADFTAIGSLGTANAKTNASGYRAELAMSPSRSVSANRIVVVWFASDSIFWTGQEHDDPLNYTMSCRDSQGNIYTTIAAAVDGESAIYAQAAIFVGWIQNALTTSDTITVAQWVIGPGSQVVARGMSAEEFSIPAGMYWAVFDAFAKKVTTRASDPGSISISSGLVSTREYLILHALGAEGPNTDSYTWDSDYTQVTGAGTTGGNDDTNAHVRGGYRIVSGITSDTVDVTSDTADRDYTQVMQAIAVVQVPLNSLIFPTAPILDDFNRANEDPLGTALGNWITTNCSPRGPGAGTDHLAVVGQEAAGTFGGSWYATLWDALQPDEGFEAYVTIKTPGWFSLHMRGTGCSETATVDGLSFTCEPAGSYPVQVDGYFTFGSSGLQGGIDQARGKSWIAAQAGWKIGMQQFKISLSPPENVIIWWIERGSGWEPFAAVHGTGELSEFDDADEKIGLEARDSITRLDDLGGGPWRNPGMPEFLRRPWEYHGGSVAV